MHEDDISIELKQIISEFIDDSISKHCQGLKENWDIDSYKFELLDIFGIDMKFNDDEDVKILKDET